MSELTTNPVIDQKVNNSSPAIFYLVDGSAIFPCSGSPEAVIAADPGSIAIDVITVPSAIYHKQTGTGNTGWFQVGNLAIGSTITGGTQGSVLFVGPASVIAQDNANFFWDDTNNKLQIGQAVLAYVFGGGGNGPVSGMGFNGGNLCFTHGSNTGLGIIASGGVFFVKIRATGHFGFTVDGFNDNLDCGIARKKAATIRISNGDTGAGNILVGTSTVGDIGTNGVGVIALAVGTVPINFPTDTTQIYTKDSAAGDANLYISNEAGVEARITGCWKQVETQVDQTTGGAFVALSALQFNLEAGSKYGFEVVLFTQSDVTEGVKARMSGSAVINSLRYEGHLLNNNADGGQARGTVLNTTVAAVTAVTAATVFMYGSIDVNTAGTFRPEFDKNVEAGGGTTSVLTKSYMRIWKY